jgi:threonine dehydrogenase-like Zn-dependent dehydrogenase
LKAAIYRGPYDIKIEQVPEPEVKGSRVLVHFKAGSICGTDMHLYRGDWKWMKKGRILRHDAWGVRDDMGERVVMVPMVNWATATSAFEGSQLTVQKASSMA